MRRQSRIGTATCLSIRVLAWPRKCYSPQECYSPQVSKVAIIPALSGKSAQAQLSFQESLQMKCPVCLDDNVRKRQLGTASKIAAYCLFLVPMRCRHCFHRFYVSRFQLWRDTEGSTTSAHWKAPKSDYRTSYQPSRPQRSDVKQGRRAA